MNDVDGCLACDLIAGREELPGGVIWETPQWVIEHCVGPLGVGTLLLKPRRHITHVAELTPEEAVEYGPLLRVCAIVVDRLVSPEQTYVALWSHAGAQPVHIHWVIQPVTKQLMEEHGVHGPALQLAMFTAAVPPPADAVIAFADQARAAFEELL